MSIVEHRPPQQYRFFAVNKYIIFKVIMVICHSIAFPDVISNLYLKLNREAASLISISITLQIGAPIIYTDCLVLSNLYGLFLWS